MECRPNTIKSLGLYIRLYKVTKLKLFKTLNFVFRYQCICFVSFIKKRLEGFSRYFSDRPTYNKSTTNHHILLLDCNVAIYSNSRVVTECIFSMSVCKLLKSSRKLIELKLGNFDGDFDVLPFL